MWKLLQWFCAPTKMEQAAAQASVFDGGTAHENDSETSEVQSVEPVQAEAQPNSVDMQFLNQPAYAAPEELLQPAPMVTEASADSTMGELKMELETLNQADLMAAAAQAQLRAAIKPETFRHDSDIRRSGMAYWRKNTRKERPTDSRYYDHLTSPGSNWQDPFTADANKAKNVGRRQEASIGHDLSNLSAFLTSNNKNYLSGMYTQKRQSEIEGQTFDALPPVSSTSRETSNYPHYQGGWEPNSLDELEPVQPQPFDSQMSELSAQEQSLAVTEEARAKQSTTLDQLPYAQFIDVRIAVADHPDTSSEVMMSLAQDESPDVRFAIAENHNTSIELLTMLTDDANPYVAHRARKTIQRIEGGEIRQGKFTPVRTQHRVTQ